MNGKPLVWDSQPPEVVQTDPQQSEWTPAQIDSLSFRCTHFVNG